MERRTGWTNRFFSFKKPIIVATAKFKTPFLLHENDISTILLDNLAGVIMIALDSKSGDQYVVIQYHQESDYLFFSDKPPIPVSVMVFKFEQDKFNACFKIIKSHHSLIRRIDEQIRLGFPTTC